MLSSLPRWVPVQTAILPFSLFPGVSGSLAYCSYGPFAERLYRMSSYWISWNTGCPHHTIGCSILPRLALLFIGFIIIFYHACGSISPDLSTVDISKPISHLFCFHTPADYWIIRKTSDVSICLRFPSCKYFFNFYYEIFRRTWLLYPAILLILWPRSFPLDFHHFPLCDLDNWISRYATFAFRNLCFPYPCFVLINFWSCSYACIPVFREIYVLLYYYYNWADSSHQ